MMSEIQVKALGDQLRAMIPGAIATFKEGLVDNVRRQPEPLSNPDLANILTGFFSLIEAASVYCDHLLTRIEGLETEVAGINDDFVRLANRR